MSRLSLKGGWDQVKIESKWKHDWVKIETEIYIFLKIKQNLYLSVIYARPNLLIFLRIM